MKKFLSVIAGIVSLLGILGGMMAANLWAVTLVVLSILKLTSTLDIAWFAGISTLSAIGTPLFMLVIGLVLIVINIIILAIISEINN